MYLMIAQKGTLQRVWQVCYGHAIFIYLLVGTKP
jgi:hypothetical protein